MDTLGEEITKQVETIYSNVGEVKDEVLLNKKASRKAMGESHYTCRQADQAVGEGDKRYTG